MSKFPTLALNENGIFLEYHFDEFISKSCAMFVAEERNRLSKNIRRPLLVEFKELKGFSPETRCMDLNFILNSVSALAYYMDINTKEGRQSKQVADSFFSITPWPIPVKIFHDKNEALNWLKKYLPDNQPTA